MKKRLLLRADASLRMGTGHVMRGLSLAQAWQDLGGEATLLARELPAALASRLQHEGLALQTMPESADDAAKTIKAAADADWLVVDGYQFDAAYCDRVFSAARHALMLDDFGQLPHYGSEVVLNQNISASEALYTSREATTSLLCGCRFALLRREFRRPPVARDPSLLCDRVLVTLGGSDPDDVTSKVITALEMLPHLQAQVIVGAANPRREFLQERCDASGGRIELAARVEDLVPLMDRAHIAVSAGGTSVLELASRGLPTLLLAIADNQRAICETMDVRGVMTSVGWHEDVSADVLAAAIGKLAAPAAAVRRRDFTRHGMQLVDGRGALRVAREMMARDVMSSMHVRRAGAEDIRRVFEWANDPVTRSVSFNSAAIDWEEHQAWFSRKLGDPSCRLLIGEDTAGVPFGMVRFDLAGSVATISINLAPGHRQRGLGTSLLLVACRDLLREGDASEVHALIKPGNAASQRVFQRAGFEPAPDVDVTGQRAWCMVLK